MGRHGNGAWGQVLRFGYRYAGVLGPAGYGHDGATLGRHVRQGGFGNRYWDGPA